MKPSTPKNFLLLLFSLLIAFLLLEMGLRSYYYGVHGPFQLASTHAIARLVEISKLPGVSGIDLNMKAWEASYTERGLVVPPDGPREGYWGSRIAPKNEDCGLLGVCESARHIPGLVEIDSNGFQCTGTTVQPHPHVLIIGGSVAFGAYASTIEKTYFVRLHQILTKEFPRAKITVYGQGAALSDNDVAALALKGLALKPDVVVFLNGLNDLANPGEKSLKTRSREYLRNMKVAGQIAECRTLPVVFALQPFLGGKRNKTLLERRILALSGEDYEALYAPHYEAMKQGLRAMVREESMFAFSDCSGVFDNETATTFADQWHFSDPGHELLAQNLSFALVPLLRKLNNSLDRR